MKSVSATLVPIGTHARNVIELRLRRKRYPREVAGPMGPDPMGPDAGPDPGPDPVRPVSGASASSGVCSPTRRRRSVGKGIGELAGAQPIGNWEYRRHRVLRREHAEPKNSRSLVIAAECKIKCRRETTAPASRRFSAIGAPGCRPPNSRARRGKRQPAAAADA
jgi:hypothetical protein